MSALLTQIPDAQDVTGLLRLWSPVVLTGAWAGYKSAIADLDRLAVVSAEGSEEQEVVALDLTDPTGRVHAAWWCRWKLATAPFTAEELTLVEDAERGIVMIPSQIDALARLVLRLAGREP